MPRGTKHLEDIPHVLYEVTSPNTDGKYIGITMDPHNRWLAHKRSARRNDGWSIHKAMYKYGIDSFVFTEIKWYPKRSLAGKAEEEAIASGNYRYNEAPGNDRGPGFISPEGIKRIKVKASQPRGPMPQYQRDAIGRGNKGKKQGPPSEETRKRISDSKKGVPQAPGFGEKISKIVTGRKKSPEEARQISLRQLGLPKSAQHRESLRKGSQRRWARLKYSSLIPICKEHAWFIDPLFNIC